MSGERYSHVKLFLNEQKSILKELSQALWNKPELGFEEKFAHGYLTDLLQQQGFEVQRSYKLPTAFRADFCLDKNSNGPAIAVLCEYDALPMIGHACGHNLIAECGVGAAMAVKAMLESGKVNSSAKLVVLGTPAEEGGGGKIKLVDMGGFEDIDMAMMVHPAPGNFAHPLGYLCTTYVMVKFRGKTAHAANYPWCGHNALDAVVQSYTSISSLRQQMKPDWRVHLNIVDGGRALNCIPDTASMEIGMRALSVVDLEELKGKIMCCVSGASMAMQCEIETTDLMAYKNVISNFQLAKTYRKYSEMSGEKFLDDDPHQTLVTFGSTDMGDVTHIMPGIHPKFFIGNSLL